MALQFNCKSCGKVLVDSTARMGDAVQCYRCGNYNIVPDDARKVNGEVLEIDHEQLKEEFRFKQEQKKLAGHFYYPFIKPSDLNRKTARKAVNHAIIGGIIIILYSLWVMTFSQTVKHYPIVAELVGIEIIIFTVLTIGVVLKNSICAILLLVYFIISQTLLIYLVSIEFSSYFAIPLAIMLWRGVIGTIALRKTDAHYSQTRKEESI